MIQEPIQPIVTTKTLIRSHRESGIKLGVLIALILLAAIPVVMAMNTNASPSSDQLIAAGASSAPAGAKPDKGLGGPKGGPGGPGGHITIRALSGNQISLVTPDGWSRTITATSDTVITKGGVTITVGDLKVGDEIHFRQTRNDDGSFTIVAIDVPTPHAGGEVSAVSGNDITVKDHDGTTKVITVTGSTVYKLGPTTGSKSDVKVGTNIDAAGTVSGTTFTATSVNIKLPHLDGEVTGKTSSTITVKDHDGATKVIHVTGSTTYKVAGKDTASLSDIAVGDHVNGEGALRSDGSIDAVAVHGGPPKGVKPPKPASSTAPG